MSLTERPPAFFQEKGKIIGEAKTIPDLIKALKEAGIELKEGEKILHALEKMLGIPESQRSQKQKLTIDGVACTLSYNVVKAENSTSFTVGLSLERSQPADEQELKPLAERNWMFLPSYYWEEVYDVTSSMKTAVGWEGKGIGQALFLASNIVIRDCIQRGIISSAQQLDVKITDQAKPNDSKAAFTRKDWTSNMAQLLGFKPDGHKAFKKVFRV